MFKLDWQDIQHITEVGSTGNPCNIDVYDANVNIKLGEDSIFAFGVCVFSETDIKTGEQIVTGSYSPQGEYCDVYIPLDETDTKYESIEDAKEACENKVAEVLKYLYAELEPLICRFS